MKYKWLLFDADGTLYDYDSAESEAFQTTLIQFGLLSTPCQLGFYREINHKLFQELEKGQITSKDLRTRRFEILFSKLNVDMDINKISDQYLINLSKCSQLIPGASDTVRALHSDFNMIIISNGIPDVQIPRFDNSEIRPYFSDIILSDDIGVAKPGKEIFEYAFKKMGYPEKEEVMLIGDSLSADMAGGFNFDIDTCWYNPNKEKNTLDFSITHEIHKLDELVPLLRDAQSINN